MRPRLRAYCERELVHLKRYKLLDTTADLYMRPWVAIHGESGGWVTSRGITVTGKGELLRKAPTVELRGKINLAWIGRPPGVTAALQRENGQRLLPATMDVNGYDYRLRFTLPVGELEAGPVEVQVQFDRYFVPRDLGMSADSRQLVVCWPLEVKALR
jgi:hypothetical protein